MTHTLVARRVAMALLTVAITAFAIAAPLSADRGEADDYTSSSVGLSHPMSRQDNMVWSGDTDLAGIVDTGIDSFGLDQLALAAANDGTESVVGGGVFIRPTSHQDTMVWSGDTDFIVEADALVDPIAPSLQKPNVTSDDPAFHTASHQDTMTWSGETDLVGVADTGFKPIVILDPVLVASDGANELREGGDSFSHPASHQDSMVWSGETDLVY